MHHTAPKHARVIPPARLAYAKAVTSASSLRILDGPTREQISAEFVDNVRESFFRRAWQPFLSATCLPPAKSLTLYFCTRSWFMSQRHSRPCIHTCCMHHTHAHAIIVAASLYLVYTMGIHRGPFCSAVHHGHISWVISVQQCTMDTYRGFPFVQQAFTALCVSA